MKPRQSVKEVIAIKRKLRNYVRRDSMGPVLIQIFLVALLLASAFLFSASFRSLRLSIQQERVDYVEEIASQIMSNYNFMETEYAATVRDYAMTVSHCDISGLSDLRDHLSPENAQRVLVLDESGNLMDLEGRSLFLLDRSLYQALAETPDQVQLFASLSGGGDYWLFAASVEPVALAEGRITAVVLAIPSDEFQSSLSIQLMDGQGISYIIENSGAISVKPKSEEAAFPGYNLFAALVRAGVNQQLVDQLRENIEQNDIGSQLLTIDGNQWLVEFNALDDHNSIVVTIPLSITAANTFEGLTDTIVYSALFMLAFACLTLSVILRFLHRDRQRAKQVAVSSAKNDFFSRMSHDIRTPLNAIMGLQTLAAESSDFNAVRDYMSRASTCANYLQNLINDVLDMNRIDSGHMTLADEPFNMISLVDDVKSIIGVSAREKALDFTVETDVPFTCGYRGDPVHIRQILVNLLNNAVKFTQPGGSVTLVLSHRDIRDGRDEVSLLVRDTGIGMSREFMSRIFTPFEQENASHTGASTGSGLGLSIVDSLVELMGGGIGVDSQQGAGTVFTVTLPLTRAGSLPVIKPAQTQPLLYPGRRALLAEDNDVNQRVAVALLQKKFSLSAEVAPDGAQALKMFSQSKPGYYDLIFMDVRMPVLDGLEATRLIRALPRQDARTIPIVALSANATPEDVAKSRSAGMDDHLPKPLDIKAIAAVLRRFIPTQEDKP